MIKKFLCAFSIAYLFISLSVCKAQSDLIKVDLLEAPNCYAKTLRSDVELGNRLLKEAAPLAATKTTSELMIFFAEKLLNTPYVAGTLEGGEKEELRVFLHKTDCILFVETCLNLAECVKMYGDKADFEKFANLVRQSRYRNGVVENYSDRIHYTTEWIRQQEARGLVKDITQELGGKVYDHPIFFMSKNNKYYAQLKNAEGNKDLERIAEVEKELNKTPFYYIPQEDIPKIEDKIKSGDIICYMSGTQGLDIAHVTMAYVKDGKVGFVHASMGAMRVIVDPKSIYEYVKASKNITGIKVVRPL